MALISERFIVNLLEMFMDVVVLSFVSVVGEVQPEEKWMSGDM
jgi:hypothetical protein